MRIFERKKKIMKVLKEQIRSIVITRIPFAIIDSKGKMKYPFISSSASEQVVNALVNGIYEELSKLHQPTVIVCLHPFNEVVSGDDGDFCCKCQTYLKSNRL